MTYDDDPAQPFIMCVVVLCPFVVYVLSNWHPIGRPTHLQVEAWTWRRLTR